MAELLIHNMAPIMFAALVVFLLVRPAKMKPVPTAAVAAVGDTLRENGLPSPSGGGATFLQAKTANEVLKSQERRLKLQKL